MITSKSANNEPDNGFFYEPSVLPYFLTPALMISLFTTILSPHILSPLLWRAVFGIRTPAKSKILFHSLLSSTVHAIISSSLSLYILISGQLGANRCFSKAPLGFTTVQISLGYWLGDLIVFFMHINVCKYKGGIFHHLIAIISLALCLFLQGKIMFFIICHLMSSISVPVANLRRSLSYTGYKTGLLYYFSSTSTLILFFLCRVVTIPWHWYEIILTLYAEDCALMLALSLRIYLVLSCGVIDTLNMYWCFRILNGVIKLYGDKLKTD